MNISSLFNTLIGSGSDNAPVSNSKATTCAVNRPSNDGIAPISRRVMTADVGDMSRSEVAEYIERVRTRIANAFNVNK